MQTRFPLRKLATAVTFSSLAPLSVAQVVLEEIVVTAQKRAESLQDVPISVSAIQGDKIEEAGVFNMAALADYVPNLHIANAPLNTNIYMRGVGSGNNMGFEQSVGMYIDGVYMGRGRQYRNAFLDLERIEVLRGPQGTLFGRNTVAGAVNITTASPLPGDDTQAEIAISAETEDGLVAEGFISGSLSDQFAARLAFKHRESDGSIDNTFLDRSVPQVEETAFRLTAVWQPSDNLDINFKYSNSDEEQVGAQTSTWLYLDPGTRDAQVPNRSAFANTAYGIIDAFFPNFAEIADEEFTTFKDEGFGNDVTTVGIGRNPDGNEAEVDNFVLDVDYAWGDYTFTAVTGWSEYGFELGIDVDWLPLQFLSQDEDQSYEQFSQELRITSPGGQFFDFVAGAYYDNSELYMDRLVQLDGSFDGLFQQATGVNSVLTALTGGVYTSNQIGRRHIYELESESWALFFQGTFTISDTVRLTLGLRYTEETKDVYSDQILTDDFSGRDTQSFNFILHSIWASQFNTYRYSYTEDRKTDDTIPSVNVQWDVADDHMLYASFSQGFKSGGFTAADDGEPGDLGLGQFPCAPNPDLTLTVENCYDISNPNDLFEFDDESVDAYEIGGKHTLMGGAINLNWAAFYTEYANLQTGIFRGIGFTVTNAGSSEIQGIELDILWAATENLVIGANAAYLDATYDEFEDAPCTVIQLDADPLCGTPAGISDNDLSGEPTLYASDYSASIFWDWSYPLEAWELFVGGEVNYRDEFHTAGDNDPVDLVDSYYKVNLRIGARSDNWEIMAFGRNIFDEFVAVQSYDVPVLAGSHGRTMDEGAIFGVRAKYMFGQ